MVWMTASAHILTNQRADAAGGLKVVVILVLALGWVAIAGIGAITAAADVDEGDGGL